MNPPSLRLAADSTDLEEPLNQEEAVTYVVESEPLEHVWSLRGIVHESLSLLRLAVPLSIQYVFAYTTLTVSTAFCGHLGSLELSVAVLSTSIYNVMGYSILVGFSSAIETLCGMAYGAKNYAKMGILLQRAVIVCTTVYLMICVLWIFMGPLLRLAGQEQEIAFEAARYLHLSMPALFFAGCFNCVLQRYLQSQGIVFPVTAAVAVIALLAPFYLYFFMYGLGLGLYGAPLATGANNFSIALAMVIITVWRERCLWGTEKQMWRGWSRRAFKGLGTYMTLAVPSTGMILAEWWAFEVVVLMSGMLSDPQVSVSTMGVLMNLNALIYMVPRGMSGAASTRVSNELGAARPAIAKRAAWTAIVLGGGSAGLLAVVCYLLRQPLVGIFTKDPQVIANAQQIFYVMCFTIFTDGVNVSIEGVIRGSGRQMLAASINLFTYWGVGIPTAFAFGFPAGLGLRVAGFWYSRALVTTLQCVIMLGVLVFYDWPALATLAVASCAAATPRVGGATPESKQAGAVFSRTPEEIAALAASQQLAASGQLPSRTSGQQATRTLAINVRRQREEGADSEEAEELAKTPCYSFTNSVTPGGTWAARC